MQIETIALEVDRSLDGEAELRPGHAPPIDRQQVVAQREWQLQPVEMDALAAQEVADAGQRGHRQQAREQRRVEQREAVDPQLALEGERRHLLQDLGLQLELAALDLGGLIQRPQESAGVVTGDAQRRCAINLGQGQRHGATFGQPAMQLGRAPAFAVADQTSIHLAHAVLAEQDPVGSQVDLSTGLVDRRARHRGRRRVAFQQGIEIETLRPDR